MHGKGSSCFSMCNSKASSSAKRVRMQLWRFVSEFNMPLFFPFLSLFYFAHNHIQQHLLTIYISCSVFNHLLDDTPLPANEVSSSVLLATYSLASLQNGKGAIGGGKPTVNGEVEKGLLTLVSSDSPGLQVSVSFKKISNIKTYLYLLP